MPVHGMEVSGCQLLTRLREQLIPPRAACVVDDLALNNPLALVIPPGTMAVMTAVALPIVADFALVLNLSNAVLSPSSDTVRYLD